MAMSETCGHTVTVYLTKSDNIDVKSPLLAGILSSDRRGRIERLAKDSVKRESCAAELLLCYALCGTYTPPLPVSRTDRGKPYVEGSDTHFSLSHSHGYAICATSDCEVGADVEKNAPVASALARRIGAADIQSAYRVWSIKEAFLKLTGEGIGGRYALGDIVIEDNRVYAHDTAAYYRTYDYGDMIISVCSYEDFELKIKELSPYEVMTAVSDYLL